MSAFSSLDDRADGVHAPDRDVDDFEIFSAAEIGGSVSRWKRAEPLVVGALSVLILLGLWQFIVSEIGVSPIILPTPSGVISSFHSYVSTGQIWPDLRASGEEFGYGFVIAVVGGIVIGLLAGWFQSIRSAIAPFTWFFLSVPVIALTPLIIIWAGIGLESKVIVIAASGFLPIFVSTVAGVREIDPNLIRLERSYGARRRDLFRTLALPGSVPFILSGVRIGIGHALIGLYVAEITTGSYRGIGYMMLNAGADADPARVFDGLCILGFGGLALAGMVTLLQRTTRYGRQGGGT